MKCKCGFENIDGAVFCAECGLPLTNDSKIELNKIKASTGDKPGASNKPSTVKNGQKTGNKKILMIIFCCIIIAFLGVIVVLLLRNSETKSTGLNENVTNFQIQGNNTENYSGNNSGYNSYDNSDNYSESMLEDVSIGDIVTFGTYEQDNDIYNGKEDIEWIVLDIQDNQALLLTKYELFSSAYNNTRDDVTWETCSLRSKLNYQFYNEAFNEDEKSLIVNTTVSADSNPKQSTDSGKSTVDKLFLLSILEVNRYFSTYDQMHSYPTAYAIANGAYAFPDNGGTGAWWTRTPGKVQSMCAIVGCVDGVLTGGDYVDFAQDSVRPAMWVELS